MKNLVLALAVVALCGGHEKAAAQEEANVTETVTEAPAAEVTTEDCAS